MPTISSAPEADDDALLDAVDHEQYLFYQL
jgi:hypothetical protein